jgi:hypothetical protein
MFYRRKFHFISATYVLSVKIPFYQHYLCFIGGNSILSALPLIYRRKFHFISATYVLSAKIPFYQRYLCFISENSILSALPIFLSAKP